MHSKRQSSQAALDRFAGRQINQNPSAGRYARFGLAQVVAGSLLLLACLDNAHAQTAKPAEPVYGPAVNGVCVFSRDAAIDGSQAGLSATRRMQELTTQVNTEISPERDAIAKEQQSLASAKTTMPAKDSQTRATAVAARLLAFERKVQLRNTQLVKTREAAMTRLTDALRPALVATITAHKCSLVFERANIYGFNSGMDITPDVTAKMNDTIKAFGFNLTSETDVQPAKNATGKN